MYKKSAILICFLFFIPVHSEISPPTDTSGNQSNRSIKITAGAVLLGIECIGFPLLDVKFNYGKIPRLRNPFRYVKEKEPFHEDELWHFVGASAFTELNYALFQDLLFIENPYIITGLTSIAFWTGMECFDALSGSGFSVRDECGNVFGTLFSLYSIKHPDFPVRMRIGVKNLRSFSTALKKAVSGSVHHQLGKQYDFMKVELIYMIPDLPVYTGVAVSRNSSREDLYGVTAGLDILEYCNGLKSGWWNKPLAFVGNHFSLSVNFTWWWD
jgi:hypothetical protein